VLQAVVVSCEAGGGYLGSCSCSEKVAGVAVSQKEAGGPTAKRKTEIQPVDVPSKPDSCAQQAGRVDARPSVRKSRRAEICVNDGWLTQLVTEE